MLTVDGAVVLTHIPSPLFSVSYFTTGLSRTTSQWGFAIFLETVQMTCSQGHAVVHAHIHLQSTEVNIKSKYTSNSIFQI